jgi:hypothetical protein
MTFLAVYSAIDLYLNCSGVLGLAPKKLPEERKTHDLFLDKLHASGSINSKIFAF